jgi:ketosteroid isomerase-like protein
MGSVTRRKMFTTGAVGAVAAAGLLGQPKGAAAAAPMTPSEKANLDLVNEFCRSWGDKATTVAQIMSHMTEDCSFQINGQPPIVGKAAVAAAFEGFFKDGSVFEMITHETFVKGPVVINASTDTTIKPTGRAKPSPIVVIFLFKYGKIHEWEEVIYPA